MKFITYRHLGEEFPGLLLDNKQVLPLPFQSLLELIERGPAAVEQARALHEAGAETLPLSAVTLCAPLPRPPCVRDFYAFEEHVAAANANRGRSIPEEWYQVPVFYFSNPGSIIGPDDMAPYPSGSSALDYELEIACIIGRAGRDIAPETAEDHIFGYTIMNDWSARDFQQQEMRVGLGPAKGKDFATSLGPWLVTRDELADRWTGRPGVFDLAMSARVNSQERSRSNLKTIHYSFGQMIARASAGVWLYPGDVIGSGTAGTGCLLELTRAQGPWLQPGDVVELEVERLGVLRNTVASSRQFRPGFPPGE